MATYTDLLFHDAARTKLLKGATALADAVRGTLGPEVRAVLIEKKYGAPVVCDDGVTIAKELKLKDPVENLGAQLLRDAAVQTNDAVGDGTTTSTLLAHAMFAEGLRHVMVGCSAVEVRKGMRRGVAAAVEALRAQLTGLIEERDGIVRELNDWNVRIRRGVGFTYGLESPQYKMVGGTPPSERKPTTRKPKAPTP